VPPSAGPGQRDDRRHDADRTDILCQATRLLVNDDGPTTNGRRRLGGVVGAHLVVVDHLARGPVPDLDAEPVGTPAAVHLPIGGRQQEAVIPGPVDRAPTFELGPGPGDHEPVVAGAVKVQVAGFELELGPAGWGRGALKSFQFVLSSATPASLVATPDLNQLCAMMTSAIAHASAMNNHQYRV
jgi:hypothetical protein